MNTKIQKASLIFILCLITLALLACTEKKIIGDENFNSPADNIDLEQYYKPVQSALRINEVMPNNNEFYDRDGDDPGWIEICNSYPDSINLKGYYLTENLSDSTFWAFPDMELKGDSCTYVFASGKNYGASEDEEENDGKTDLLSEFSNFKVWADNEAGRNSSWEPYEIENNVLGLLNGDYAISATFDHQPNDEVENWTTVMIILYIDQIVKGLEGYDKVDFIGTIPEGKQLSIRFLQNDLEEWEGWGEVITGTGIENDTYTLTLPKFGMNHAEVYGIRIEAPGGVYGKYSFTITDITLFGFGNLASERPHTNFKLERDGGSIFLVDTLDLIHDQLEYPAIPANSSFGRLEENYASTVFLQPPTPGQPNTSANALAELTNKPLAGPAPGFYQEPIEVFFVTKHRDEVHYTTDGSEPTKDSPLWDNTAINVNVTTIFKIKAWDANGESSPTQVASYFIDEYDHKIPVFSIITNPGALFDPDTGMYMTGNNAESAMPHYGANYWEEKELPMNITFFENSKDIAWQHDAGLQIFGNWSRSQEKKSLSIHFREQYGVNKIEHLLFPDFPQVNEFKSFVLRNNGNGFNSDYIRDALASSLLEDDMQVDYQKHRYATIYLNGKYWGIHNIREKLNANYFMSNYNIEEANLDIRKISEMQNGFEAQWTNLETATSKDLSNTENYQAVKEIMNIQSFTNYMIWEMFVVNKDWPANNWKAWRSDQAPEFNKWKWIIYDMDFGFGQFGSNASQNMMDWCTNTAPTKDGGDYPNGANTTLMFRNLLKNPEYQSQFINRNAVILSTRLHPDNIIDKMEELMNEYSTEKEFDMNRWDHDKENFDDNENIIRNFINDRPEYHINHIMKYFSLNNLVNVTLIAESGGKIQVHDEDIPNNGLYAQSNTIRFFKDYSVKIKAVPDAGRSFFQWSDGNTNDERIITPSEGLSLTASFN